MASTTTTQQHVRPSEGNTNEYWRRDQGLDKLDATVGPAFRAVHDVDHHRDLSLREAAYLIAIDRVAKACRARGWT
jgi:glutamate dehydrogenase